MNKQQKHDEYVSEVAGKLAGTVFPAEIMHPRFSELLNIALRSKSIATLKCALGTYSKFALKSKELTMPEMLLALEIISTSTPDELGSTNEQYLDAIEYIYIPMRQAWHKIESEVALKVGEDIASRQPVKGKKIPLTK